MEQHGLGTWQAVDAIAKEDGQARRRLSLRPDALKENLAVAHRLLHEQRRLVRQQDSQLGAQAPSRLTPCSRAGLRLRNQMQL